MKVLVRKMSSLGLVKFQMIKGLIVAAFGSLCIPVSLAVLDATLLLNPYIWLAELCAALCFGVPAYFLFIRPYFIYCSLPSALVETDGEFIYIHTKKEAKIPLSSVDRASVYVDLPFSLVQDNFIEEVILHLGSENYGTLELELPGHGYFKMRFVAEVEDTGDELIGFFNELFKEADEKEKNI